MKGQSSLTPRTTWSARKHLTDYKALLERDSTGLTREPERVHKITD